MPPFFIIPLPSRNPYLNYPQQMKPFFHLYVPIPCGRPYLNVPSKKSPLGKCYFPKPCFRKFKKQPSYFCPFLVKCDPQPSTLPLTHCPIYTSPFLDFQTPVPCFLFFCHSPEQYSPLCQKNSPTFDLSSCTNLPLQIPLGVISTPQYRLECIQTPSNTQFLLTITPLPSNSPFLISPKYRNSFSLYSTPKRALLTRSSRSMCSLTILQFWMNAATAGLGGMGVSSLISSLAQNLFFVFFISLLAYEVWRVSMSISINFFLSELSSLEVNVLLFSSLGNLLRHSISKGKVSNLLLFISVQLSLSLLLALRQKIDMDLFSGLVVSREGRVQGQLKLCTQICELMGSESLRECWRGLACRQRLLSSQFRMLSGLISEFYSDVKFFIIVITKPSPPHQTRPRLPIFPYPALALPKASDIPPSALLLHRQHMMRQGTILKIMPPMARMSEAVFLLESDLICLSMMKRVSLKFYLKYEPSSNQSLSLYPQRQASSIWAGKQLALG